MTISVPGSNNNVSAKNNQSTTKYHINVLLKCPNEVYTKQTINTASFHNDEHFTIPLQIIQPISHKVDDAVADTGANIDVIGPAIADKYKEFIIKCRGVSIRTAGGNVVATSYLPVHIYTKGKILSTKLYVLEDLPYDYLIGRRLIRALGYDFHCKPPSIYHPAQNIEDIDEELDAQNCTLYPLDADAMIDPAKLDKVTCGSEDIRTWLKQQMSEINAAFASNEMDSGQIPDTEFKIEFKEGVDTTPLAFKEYPHSQVHVKEIERQLNELMTKGFISVSTSPWRAPTFIVPKKTGDARIVFDYRGLNAITKTMQYGLPNPTKLMTEFKDKSIMSSIDIKSGYWHIPVRKSDRERLAFVFNNKLYHWNVMPFGPKNAPAYFQKTMNAIFANLPFVVVYMDDVTILSKDIEEHKKHLTEVFNIIKQYNIKLRIDKCIFGVQQLEFLGFLVNKYGIIPTNRYKEKILNIPRPTNKKEMERFVGLVNYLHRFIPNLHIDLSPMSKMTHKNVNFAWTEDTIKHFEKIREKVQKSKIIYHPDFNKEFFVVCDASQKGIGGMLAQKDENGILLPIEFCSKTFNTTQQNWHVSEQEVYAVIYMVEKWRHILLSKKFTVYTDHLNLQELFNKCKNFRAGKLYRWAVRLQDFDFEAKYIPGDDNIFADYLSRDGLPINKRTKNGIDILEMYTNYMIWNSVSDCPYVVCPDHDTFDSSLYQQETNEDNACYVSKRTPFNVTPQSDDPDDSDYTPDTREYFTRSYLETKDNTDNTNESNVPPLESTNIPPSNTTNNKIKITHGLSLPSLDYVPTDNPPITPISNTPIPHAQPARYSKRLKAKIDAADDTNIQQQKLLHVPTSNESVTASYRREYKKAKALNEKILSYKPDYPLKEYPDKLIPTPNIPILDMYTADDLSLVLIRNKQLLDPICFAIMSYFATDNVTFINDIPGYIRRYVVLGRFSMSAHSDDRLPVLLYTKEAHTKPRIVVPAALRHSLLYWIHGTLHHGKDKLHLLLRDKYWWPKMAKDIADFASSCPACQSSKRGRRKGTAKSKLKLFPATKPFQHISIDIVGPLPVTRDYYRYIVTIIDKFSRFCLLTPVKDIRAITVLKAYERWITLFGPPDCTLSDNGTQFISAMFASFNKYNKTKLKFTTSYHPECNGQIERLHRWIKERLALIGYDTGKDFVHNIDDDWSEYLNIIQYVYNSTPTKMTQYAPSEIIFGYKVRLPTFTPLNESFDTHKTPKEYIDYMTKRRKIIFKEANINQKHYDELRKKSYDKKRNNITYNVGDYVLQDIAEQLVGNDKKFTPNYVGPYEVVEVRNDGANYRIIDTKYGTNSHIVSAKHLKPYTTRPDEVPHSHLLQIVGPSLTASRYRIDLLTAQQHHCYSIITQNEINTIQTKGSKLSNLLAMIMHVVDSLPDQQ